MELVFVAMAITVAYGVGREVAKDVWRHWLIGATALVLAGVAAANHMTVNGFPLLVVLVAVAAGILGEYRVCRRAFARLRKGARR